jgi:hypothetical protein
VRSLVLAVTVSLGVSTAWAKPPLESLPPASQVQKQFTHDVEDVRLFILASPT